MLILDEEKIFHQSLETKINMSFKQFIEFNDINLDIIKIDNFFHNLHNNIPIYMNNTMIEYFGYSGPIKTQKDSIKNLVDINLSEYKNQFWFEYNNKDYTIYLKNLESEYSDSKKSTKLDVIKAIYPPVPTGRGTSTTKHTLIMPKLFKEMLILCQTEKGKQIRRFYIDMLDVFNLYIRFQNNVEIRRLDQLLEDNKLMNCKLNNTMGITNRLLGETKESLDRTDKKLDKILPQRVEIDKLEAENTHKVLILHDENAESDDFNLYVLRVQVKKINSSIKRIKRKYGNNIRVFYTINQPNAISFWRIVKKEISNNMQKETKGNWFKLNISLDQFKNKLDELEKKRVNK